MITVVKRDGTRVPLDISKIQRQVAFGCQGIDGVSPSMIEIKAQIELHDGMATKTIDELLLKAMVNLIDETENPEINNTNYQYVAGRQRVSMLRKEVYGQYQPPSLYSIVKKNVEAGMYTPELLTRVRNANMASHEKVDVPFSKAKLAIVKILKDEGFVLNYIEIS